jgi:hypothetical protein
MKISIQTIFFPGMIFHEISHYLACIILRVRVRKVKLFDPVEAFVIHDKASPWKAIIISLAPFIIGNWFALELFKLANQMLSFLNIIGLLLYWFALSLVYYSFPSKEDSKNAFYSFKEFYSKQILKKGIFIKTFWVLTIPIVFIPLIIVLGIMLSFNYSLILRLFWILFIVVLSFNPTILNELIKTIF